MSVVLCDTITDENGIEITEHGTPSFPVACYAHNVSEKIVEWHWHDEFEVILVTEGTSFVFAGSEKIKLTSGKGILLNAGTLHSIIPAEEKNCMIKSVCWHPRLTGGRDESVYWQKYIKRLFAERSFAYLLFEEMKEAETRLILHVSDAWEKCAQEPDGYEFDVRYDLSKILYYGLKHQEKTGMKRKEKEIRTEKRLKQMIDFIKTNLSAQITITEIADSAGISVSEGLRCFNTILGTTPIRYVRKLRLEKAAGFLRMGKSVMESSTLSGFDDMSYFAREFKKQYGCVPSEYR